jgi:hypothetical protein
MQHFPPDTLTLICSRMDSAAPICNLSSTCKTMHRFFASTASKNAWEEVVRNVCGYGVVEGRQPLRYRAMITMSPYLAKPEIYRCWLTGFSKFEIAKRKSDNALVLWCESLESTPFHIQLSGKSKRVTADDLIFNPKPVTSNMHMDCVTAWAKINEQCDIYTYQYPFHHNDALQYTMQIHKTLFVACIGVQRRGSQGKTKLVFFTETGDSIRVLYTLHAYANHLSEAPEHNNPVAFLSFDRARLCIKTNECGLEYYGPSKDYTWKPDQAVVLRRILANQPTSASLCIAMHITNDSILKHPIMRCALESRNRAACKQILDVVQTWTHPIDKTLKAFFTENNGDTMLFTAIKTGNVETVRFLVDHKVKITSKIRMEYHDIILSSFQKPEILDLICEPSNINAFSQLFCKSVNQQTLDFCESSLNILKSKDSAIFKAGPQQMQVMEDIITYPGGKKDPGALVMNARLLRSLILMGEPLSAAKQDELMDAAISHSRFYMFTFLAAMGIGTNLKKYMRFIAEPERSSIEQALYRIARVIY